MIAYKVVRHDDGFRSLHHPTFKYKLGEFVEAPPGTGLFVFRDVLSAELCHKVDCPCTGSVFRCEVEEQEEMTLPALRLEIEDLGHPDWIARVWSGKPEDLAGLYLTTWWPEGSAAYRRVKLLEVV